MKILIHIKKFDADSTLTFILNDILYLKDKAEIKIICSDSSSPPLLFEKDVIKYPYSGNSILHKLRHFLAIHDIIIFFKNSNLKRVYKSTILKFNPDLMITHFGDESLVFLQNIKINVPTLVFFHGYDASAWLKVKKYVNIYKRLFVKKDLIPVTCSENMRTRMKEAGVAMQKAWVLYYGIDTNFFVRKERQVNEIPVFLQISSFHEKKGHVYTVKAFRKFLDFYPDKKFKLILAGDGQLRNDIINLVEQLGLKDRVSFPGWVNRTQTRSLLENADYFVHHSISDRFGNMEGIPNAIIEAMAMELPIISTFHSGIPELVIQGKNGILVEEKDISGYASAIRQILNFHYLKENRLRIEKEFNINNRVEELYKQIQILVNEKHRSMGAN